MPVVPFKPGTDKLLRLDFTSANSDLTDDIINDIGRFSHYIEQRLAVTGARYGIGGYGEHRTIYSRSGLFDDGEEPRRLHLGTDLWSPAGTPVMAPLAGTVHSFANNSAAGDYGATIILQHELDEVFFYSLYGHLSLASINDLAAGKKIAAGEQFAEFGAPSENGYWPPHLHFQLINDIGKYKGDYPGVCRFSAKEQWLRNSPEPDLVIRMNRFISP